MVIINPKDEDFKFNIDNFNDDTYSVDVNQDEIIFNIINNKTNNSNTSENINNSNTSENNNNKNVDVDNYLQSLKNYISRSRNDDKFEKNWVKCSEINKSDNITVNNMNKKINEIKTNIQNFKIYKDNIFKINEKIINQFMPYKNTNLPLPVGVKDNVKPSPLPSQVKVNSPLTYNVTPSPSQETLKNYLKEISL